MTNKIEQYAATNKIQALSNLFFDKYDVLSPRDLKEFDAHIEQAFSILERRAQKRG